MSSDAPTITITLDSFESIQLIKAATMLAAMLADDPNCLGFEADTDGRKSAALFDLADRIGHSARVAALPRFRATKRWLY